MILLKKTNLILKVRELIPIRLKIFFLKKKYVSNSIIYKLLGLTSLVEKLNKCGIDIEYSSYIKINKIFFTNPIICEMIKSKKKKIIRFRKKNKYFFKIKESIHFNLFEKINKRKSFNNSQYVKWQKYLNKKKINNRNNIFIQNRISKAKNNFFNIKKRGQIKNDINKIPLVLAKPILRSRYMFPVKYDKKNYFEVYDGHHRLAAMKYLKYKNVYVLVCKDVANKTPFGINLKLINEK